MKRYWYTFTYEFTGGMGRGSGPYKYAKVSPGLIEKIIQETGRHGAFITSIQRI